MHDIVFFISFFKDFNLSRIKKIFNFLPTCLLRKGALSRFLNAACIPAWLVAGSQFCFCCAVARDNQDIVLDSQMVLSSYIFHSATWLPTNKTFALN